MGSAVVVALAVESADSSLNSIRLVLLYLKIEFHSFTARQLLSTNLLAAFSAFLITSRYSSSTGDRVFT